MTAENIFVDVNKIFLMTSPIALSTPPSSSGQRAPRKAFRVRAPPGFGRPGRVEFPPEVVSLAGEMRETRGRAAWELSTFPPSCHEPEIALKIMSMFLKFKIQKKKKEGKKPSTAPFLGVLPGLSAHRAWGPFFN